MRRTILLGLLAFTAVCGGACGSDETTNGEAHAHCTVGLADGCSPGQVCEEVQGEDPACFAPVAFTGKVTDALDGAPVAGARLVARDPNETAVSAVAVSGPDGTYALNVPAKRDAAGAPLSVSYTLRVDAAGYLSFPKAPRVALPIDVATATGALLAVASAATSVTLLPLSGASALGSISGHVIAGSPGGALVVAGGATAVADVGGDYVVFNVPAGSTAVSAYAAGLSFDGATATVKAGEDTGGVDLVENGRPTSTLHGKVEIVNGGGASSTSVVLALEETFVETTARGEVPKGLRVANVSGSFTIAGVPDGAYVVLAAFENDGLVRDPDTSIGGTEIVHLVVAGADQTLAESFKVTGALAVVSPGADGIEIVSGTPELAWEDDSSEDGYEVRIFDALGGLTWETAGAFDPGGSKPATVPYGGPSLVPGMIYQLRVTSMKDGVPISTTEDLLGVFTAN